MAAGLRSPPTATIVNGPPASFHDGRGESSCCDHHNEVWNVVRPSITVYNTTKWYSKASLCLLVAVVLLLPFRLGVLPTAGGGKLQDSNNNNTINTNKCLAIGRGMNDEIPPRTGWSIIRYTVDWTD
jgi:hypothetical protein